MQEEEQRVVEGSVVATYAADEKLGRADLRC